jgi:hypothetical protein
LLCHAVNYDYDCYSQLSMLTMQLNSEAFHFSVYGDIFGFLVEADAKGNNFISGSFHPDFYSHYFYLQPITVPGRIKKFSLLKVSKELQAAIDSNQSPEWKQRIEKIKQKSASYLDEDLSIGYTEMIDEALKLTLDDSDLWYLYNLGYAVYFQPESLTNKGVRLLYFQPPVKYQTPCAYNLTPADELETFGVVFESMLDGTFDNFGLEAIDD